MKRFLIGIFAALLSVAASATTFTPIQLLNPTGSVAGQVIVSSGPTTVAAWGGIGVNGITALAANTVIANATGSSASPTAFAMPSCSTSASALDWTSGTGFTCNTSINAATLGGATFAAPGAIGGTTPATGAFTALSSSGNDALLYTTTSGQSISSGSPTTLITWTKVFDRLNANFNASTGVFTAPATGIYHVDAGIFYTAGTNAVTNVFQITVVGNGVADCDGVATIQAAGSFTVGANTSCSISLTSGQTIVVQAFQNSGSARTLSTAATNTYVSIHRVP